MKTFDKLFLDVFLIVFLTLLFYLIVKNAIAAMFIAYLSLIVIRSIVIYLVNRHRIVYNNVSVKEMEDIFAVWGTEKQAEYFFSLFPAYYSPELIGNKIVFRKNRIKNVIVCNYKFSPTSCDDVAKLYREQGPNEETKIYVLGKTPPKNVLLLTGTLSFDIVFLSSRKVRKTLLKHNALPESFKKKPGVKPSRKELLSGILDTSRTRYYFLSSLFFLFYSLLNVYRIWYLLLAALTFVMGALCLISLLSRKRKASKK